MKVTLRATPNEWQPGMTDYAWDLECEEPDCAFTGGIRRPIPDEALTPEHMSYYETGNNYVVANMLKEMPCEHLGKIDWPWPEGTRR